MPTDRIRRPATGRAPGASGAPAAAGPARRAARAAARNPSAPHAAAQAPALLRIHTDLLAHVTPALQTIDGSPCTKTNLAGVNTRTMDFESEVRRADAVAYVPTYIEPQHICYGTRL